MNFLTKTVTATFINTSRKIMSPQIFAIQTEIDFLENLHWERSDPLAQSESNSLVMFLFSITFNEYSSKVKVSYNSYNTHMAQYLKK